MKNLKILSAVLCVVMTTAVISAPVYAKDEEKNSSLSISYQTDNEQKLPKPILSVSEITEDTIKIKWGKIDNAEKYQIYYSTKKDGKYKKYKETTKSSITVKNLNPSTEYFFKVRAVKGEEKGKFSSVLETNTEFTVWDFNIFIKKMLNRSALKKKFGNVEVSCGENSYDSQRLHDLFPYDVTIIVNPENMWWDLYDYKYSGKWTKKQKAEFLDRNIKLQYLIFSYANRMLPGKKIEGGYFDSYYEYPALKLNLISRKAFTWVNYTHAGALSTYSDTEYTGKMEWYTDSDDYDFSLTDDMLENIKLKDILD